MPDPADYDSKDDFMAACVPEVIDEGKEQDQAVAQCNGMWEDHVNANRSHVHESQRHSAPVTNVDTAEARSETFEGRTFRVVPVVMAVGDAVMNEALVPAVELARSVPGWNGRPLPVDHPEVNGVPVSANSPDLLEKRNVGHLFNATFEDNRLKGELWVDEAKANEVAPEVIERIDAGSLEVSTAYFSADEPKAATAPDGTPYRVVHRDLLPDHLALLPEAKGACSWEDGCGAPRVNEGEEMADDKAATNWLKRVLARFKPHARSPDGEIDSRELETRLMHALEEKLDAPVFVETVFFESNQVVYEVLGDFDEPPQLKLRSYSTDEDGNYVLEDDVQDVNRVVSFEPVSNEAGSDGDGDGPPAATGTAANQGEDQMDKRIEGLIANEKAPFTEDDAEKLQAFSEEQLDELVARFEAPKGNADGSGDGDGQGDGDGAAAAAAAEEPETVEAFVERAPEGLREPLQAMLRDHEAKRERLIEAVKANEANAFTDKELRSFSDESLRKLARVAGTADDYSGQAVHAHGRGGSREDDEPYEAPDLVTRIQTKSQAKEA